MKTIKDAAQEWVNTMNAYPTTMVIQSMKDHPDDWYEVTTPTRGDSVYVYNLFDGCDDDEHYGEIKEVVGDDYVITFDNDEITVSEDDFELDRDTLYPAWGTMWAFGESADDDWLEHFGGIKAMSECGFRVYEHDEWGHFFGLDGGGYDFYKKHWIPLYKARGLQWHDEETEESA